MANIHDLLLHSSPDPLGLSQESVEPSSTPMQQNTENLTPRKTTSNNVRLQEFYLTTPPAPRSQSSSPVKVLAQAENLEKNSPWRIRVTVEAERDDADQNTSKGQNNVYECAHARTTTTRVPLKDSDDPWLESPKKARGRPRKSLDSPVKRTGTPKPKAAGRHKTILTSPAKRADTITPKKPRGRPRKSLDKTLENVIHQSGNSVSSFQAVAIDGVCGSGITESARPRSKGIKKTTSPIKVVVESTPRGLEVHGRTDSNPNAQQEKEIPSQVGSLKRKRSKSQGEAPGYESEVPRKIRVGLGLLGKNHTAMPRFEISEKSVDETSRINQGKKRGKLAIDETDDPTDEHQEYDSIMESEGFSMVSVSSLPSAKLHSSCSDDQNHHRIDEPQPNNLNDKHTPMMESSQISVPPLLKPSCARKSPSVIDKVNDGAPKLVRVARAGIALQGVLSPENANCERHKRTKIQDQSAKSPKERLDSLFSGFGAGTRRELRAGLRLGEELARRQQDKLRQVTTGAEEDGVFKQELSVAKSVLSISGESSTYTLKVPESSQTVLYPLLPNPQLPSPEGSQIDVGENQTNWKAESLAQQVVVGPHKEYNLQEAEEPGEAACVDDTMIVREAEYQSERNAVIEQIQAANASQVIVIEGDSVVEEDGPESEICEDSDIWQAEALSSSIKADRPPPEDLGLFRNPSAKPRRSQLPSPWREASQVRSVVEAGADESDRFWQPCRLARGTNEEESHGQSLDQTRVATFADHADSREESACGYDEGDIHSESIIFSSPVDSSIYSTQKVTFSAKHQQLLDMDLDESYDETRKPSTDESIDNEEARDGSSTEEVMDSQTPQNSSMTIVMVEKASEERLKNLTVPKHQVSSTQAPSSWISYLTSFVSTIRKPPIPKPRPLLPNRKQYLPTAISKGPLSIYTPWTNDHWSALYVHYAAWKEDRATFRLNPRSPLMKYINCSGQKDRWWKLVEPGDIAITDAFMEDLKRRGVDGRCGNQEMLIDAEFVLERVFVLWIAGVMNGECEVGSGITGLTLDGREMWRPELEPWFKGRESSKR